MAGELARVGGAGEAPPARAADDPLLSLEGVTKRFPGTVALDGASFTLRAGEVHGLLGENGAGKSTVVNLIGGILRPDDGRILVRGTPVEFTRPRDSLAQGIALIHQELSLLEDLSVAENVFVGRLPRRGPRVDWAALRRRTAGALDRIGLRVDPDCPVRLLSTGEQQQGEVAKALAREPDLLVMDEPTSALGEHDAQQLLDIVRKLAADGLAVLFISHRMAEIRAVTDRITVLRNGSVVLTRPTEGLSAGELAEAMMGRQVDTVRRGASAPGPPALVLRGVTTAEVADVDLEIRQGEIVGLAGAMGAGRTELMRAIYGADHLVRGELALGGQPVRVGSPADAVRLGIFLVPEDRKREGLILGMSAADNVALPYLGHLARAGLVSRPAQAAIVDRLVERLGIKVASLRQPVRELSGGNQQKIILARWLSMSPRVLLFDQPTRGLDLGAKEDVYRIAGDLAEAGVAVLFVATELPELLRVCDRIYVMRDRRVAAELRASECTEHDLFLATAGEAR
jgi:ABC-type sugar transport system ATPase subunit